MKNSIQISGYLVSKPNFKITYNEIQARDISTSRVSLAYHEGSSSNKKVSFFNLIGFDEVANDMHQNFEKGNYVMVEGRIGVLQTAKQRQYRIIVQKMNLKQWEEQEEFAKNSVPPSEQDLTAKPENLTERVE